MKKYLVSGIPSNIEQVRDPANVQGVETLADAAVKSAEMRATGRFDAVNVYDVSFTNWKLIPQLSDNKGWDEPLVVLG